MVRVTRGLGKGRHAGSDLARADAGLSFRFPPLKPVLPCVSWSQPAEALLPLCESRKASPRMSEKIGGYLSPYIRARTAMVLARERP
jgi:hypothetical protein